MQKYHNIVILYNLGMSLVFSMYASDSVTFDFIEYFYLWNILNTLYQVAG